jgi:hypothetical protein
MRSEYDNTTRKQTLENSSTKDIETFKGYIRYLLFYLSVVYFLAMYSYILDLIFYKVDYGTLRRYNYSVMGYIIVFLINPFYITLPVTLLYNYAINNLLPVQKKIRLLIGLCVGISIGTFIGGRGVGLSFYIGEYRWLKHLLVFALTGVSVELMRILVVKLRMRHKRIGYAGHSN